MSKSADPIIELHGHLLQNIFHGINQAEHNFLSEMSSRTDFFSTLQVRLYQLFVVIVRFLLSILQTISLLKTLFGIRDDATLRFFKDHVELHIQPMRFWSAAEGVEHVELSWQHTGIQGKRRTFLFLFKRCHLYFSQDKEAARIVDLGPMPEAAFQELLNRLQAFAASATIRRQITANPYRFQAEGMQRLAVAVALVLLSLTTATIAMVYAPQLWNMLHPAKTDTTETVSVTAQTGDSAPTAAENSSGLADDLSFLADKETKYREMLKLDPNNAEARQGLALLAEQYVSLARKAVKERQLERAEELAARAEAINPDLASLAAVKEKIRLLREELQPEKTVAATAWSENKGKSQTAANKEMSNRFSFLVDNGNGTLTDTRAGLIVAKYGCLDQDPWPQSIAMVSRLGDGQCGLADESQPGDWRLPSKEELPRLLEWEKSGLFSVGRGRSYWSETLHFADESMVWYVDVKSGYVDYGAKQQSRHHVWPVRSINKRPE
ncbi:DUF1566 domain-containing protein [Candidatus Magnetaquicoccus inordinatus]|uniref:Lcl C-terminal domain-containing protein n=1 Tax=Candidatus Magnetaquicoccus inordinatus TaxID=2496818 RepID=UPI00187D1491|nr:DUF1566 domain-containing protein [Candidatus Magnetaquicoccus inordinatus]